MAFQNTGQCFGEDSALGVSANQRGEIRTRPVHGSLNGSRSAKQFDGVLQPPIGVRRLMPVEAERLQGFPDGWTCLEDHPQQCDCPDSPRYRALGNAICVNVAEWVLRRLVAVDSALIEEASER